METWPFVSYLKGLDTSCIVTDSTSLTLTYTGGPMKTQMMQFRVTDKEKDLIEKCAEKARMTVSEYIRACDLAPLNGSKSYVRAGPKWSKTSLWSKADKSVLK